MKKFLLSILLLLLCISFAYSDGTFISPNQIQGGVYVKSEIDSKVSAITGEVALKANSADVYTKTQTNATIEAAIAAAESPYVKIASITVTDATTGVDITIPTGYLRIKIDGILKASGADNLRAIVNNDYSRNYYWTYKTQSDASSTYQRLPQYSASSGTNAFMTLLYSGSTGPNYINIDITNNVGIDQKYISLRGDDPYNHYNFIGNGRWESTREISVIKLYYPTYNITGSSFIVMGLK